MTGTLFNYGEFNSDNIFIGDMTNDGTLRGNGTYVGAFTNSGTISPGHSIGTITVNGNAIFEAGTVYQAELAADGTSDLIDISGTATINGGTLSLVFLEGADTSNMVWTILTADGGVSGEFDTMQSSLVLDISVNYLANSITVNAVRTMSYVELADTPNRRAIAGALDAIRPMAVGDMATFLGNFDFITDLDQARRVFDQLSPEAYLGVFNTSMTTMLLLDRLNMSRAQQLRSGDSRAAPNAAVATVPGDAMGINAGAPIDADARWSVWGKGLGSWSETESEDDYMGYEVQTGGFAMGVDGRVLDWLTIGAQFAYTSSDIDWDRDSLNGVQYGKHVGVSASADYLGAYLDGAFSYGYLHNRVHRGLAFAGKQADATYDIHALLGRIGGGYDFTVGDATFGPMGYYTWLHLDQPSFKEDGAGPFNLHMDSLEQNYSTTLLGAQGNYRLTFEQFSLLARLSAGWQHQFNDSPDLTARFQDYPGAAFSTATSDPQADGLLLQAGLTLMAREYFTASLDYTGQIGERDQSHSLGLSMGVRF